MPHIEIATLCDLPGLMDIERASHYRPWSTSIMERYVGQNAVLALRHQGSVYGFAIVTVVAGEGELLNIAVASALRGQGYAGELLQAVHDKAQAQRAERVFLEVRESNLAAIHLYERYGYCQTGVRPRYYPTAEGREDALLYCQELVE